MNKQQSKKMASLRKKLFAAIAMLLVACIMAVSSTYAWFTLSTAPEVKGISTTIGANGNLEMALGTYDTVFGGTDPSSYVGSSIDVTNDWLSTNITWGNLVDLSDGYGLDKITLYPARLNSDSGALVNRTSPLQFPKYGADGRVSELESNTLVGSYDATTGGFVYTPGDGNQSVGVSGIGTTASMSKRAFAIMNGKSAIASGKAAAANAAKDAIRNNGGKLAAIALKYQNDDGTGVVAAADIAELKAMIATLETSKDNISEALKAAVQVVLAADADLSDDEWAIAAGLAEGKDIVEYLDALGADYDSSDLTEMIAQYNLIDSKLEAASVALPESGDGVWADIKDSVSSLLNASGIKIGGYTITEVKQDYKDNGMGGDVVKDLFNKVSDGSLSYTFTADSGIFADIAVLTGNYTSSMAFPAGTEVEGLDLNMLGSKSVVVESASAQPAKGDIGILAESSAIVDAEAPAADANAAAPLTDTFGYIVDLLFRTNATESDLLLQTEGVNRYAEGAVDETEGNGSNMTFTVNAEYTKAKIEGLAAGIRVVFFDTTGAILAVGALDVAGGTQSGDAYKMDLVLHDYSIADNGVITIDGVKADSKICSLTANVKTAVSALVYLDGDVIDNSHAGVQTGLEAMLNLQFASSVELKPMVDSDLMGE